MTFSVRPTATEVTDGIDLTGKTAVVTGVNSGLGFETMRVLSLRGAHVVGLARTREKAVDACGRVAGETTPIACELSDWASVRAAGIAIRNLGRPIDILICNAGIMAPRELKLAHGLEMQFATNHMGHFILVHHLLDRVKSAEQGRIVMVSSSAHNAFTMPGGIDFDHLDASRRYRPWYYYGQSKLANLLHARALAARLADSRAKAYAVHPGIISTGLGRESGFLLNMLMLATRPTHKTIPQGAATQCFVATQPGLESLSGEYFVDCAPARVHKWADDQQLADKLWNFSMQAAAEFVD